MEFYGVFFSFFVTHILFDGGELVLFIFWSFCCPVKKSRKGGTKGGKEG
jgi:hypothetical protein